MVAEDKLQEACRELAKKRNQRGCQSDRGHSMSPDGPQPDNSQSNVPDGFNSEEAYNTIIEQQDLIDKLLNQPLVFATILSEKKPINPSAFTIGDRVSVIDKNSAFCNKIGKITSLEYIDVGLIDVEFGWSPGARQSFQIGVRSEPQVKLLGKNDGTDVLISFEGKLYEVKTIEHFDFEPGFTAKVDLKSNQIVDIYPPLDFGDVVEIVEFFKNTQKALVTIAGQDKVVNVCDKLISDLSEGDKVLLDKHNVIILRKVVPSRKFVKTNTNVTWDDIGGLTTAKQELIESIELPYTHPDIYSFYNAQAPKGILLFGPPGCGKTMLGKAAATSIAKTHNIENSEGAFHYIKAPELLNMYVGNSEANVRNIFRLGRKHYEKYNYPAIFFIDEADAILEERNSSGGGEQSNKWRESLVGMWLSEMDGMDDNNMVLMFATNRPVALDGAIVREGRIDKHIKVSRPNKDDSQHILQLHLKNIPSKTFSESEIAALLLEEIFAEKYNLYTIFDTDKNPHLLQLQHCVSGALLKGVVDKMKMISMRRDLKNKSQHGVEFEDIYEAVTHTYNTHLNLNHKFDIVDYCDTKGIESSSVKKYRGKSDKI